MLAIAGLLMGGIQAAGSIIDGIRRKNALTQAASISDMNASYATKQGEVDANQKTAEGERVASSVSARAGGSGVVADLGSPLAVQAEARHSAAFNAAQTRYGASVQAWGFKSQAAQQRYDAKWATINSYIGAAGSLAGGAMASAGAMKKMPTEPTGGVGKPGSLGPSLGQADYVPYGQLPSILNS